MVRDDRRDLHQLNGKRWLELAKSTALLVDRRDVRKLGEEEAGYQLVTKKVGKRHNLCPSEPFWEQPSTDNCTGFLVGEDVLLSAGHCFLDAGACEATVMVFDYAYHSSDADPTRLQSSSVYYCKEVLERVYEIEGLDFALVRLDRATQGRKPLTLRTRGKVAKGEAVAVIGHPLGLPTKISHGKVRAVRERDDYFVINADLWEGSSGSPVFNASTGIVDGLVARGEEDFIFDRRNDCQITKVCAVDDCEGEQVIRATKFADYVMPYL